MEGHPFVAATGIGIFAAIISEHMNFCSGLLISYHLVDQKIALEHLLTHQTECTLGGQCQ